MHALPGSSTPEATTQAGSATIELLADATRLHQAGRLEDAAPLYARVLEREASHPSALYFAGALALRRGRLDEARALLLRAAEVRPDHPGTLAALAETLLRQDAPAAAAQLADQVISVEARHAPAWFLRGTALLRLGDAAGAAASLRGCLRIAPMHADAHQNLANALLDLDDLEGAVRHGRAAVALAPRSAGALAALGHVLIRAGRWAEATKTCAAAIRLGPGQAQAHWTHGIACLLVGNWTQGWAEYEWRRHHPDFAADFQHPARDPARRWRGGGLAGETLLVAAEQGLGDALMLARYLPLLAARGARLRLECDAGLAGLLGQLAPCVARGQAPADGLWVDQMSLPRLFATTPVTVPAAGGYLRADPALVASWAARLPAGRRIGLVWAGNPGHQDDRHRSLPAGLAGRLAAAAGAGVISLQLGARAAEAAGIPGLVDLSAGLTDWSQTAAVLANLDLLISVDSAVAHCAGALGVPTWLLLPFVPDWRWLPEAGARTPWYDSMRLFRQSQVRDWDGVIDAVGRALAARPG